MKINFSDNHAALESLEFRRVMAWKPDLMPEDFELRGTSDRASHYFLTTRNPIPPTQSFAGSETIPQELFPDCIFLTMDLRNEEPLTVSTFLLL
jgi:hypothetical protein